MNIKKETYYVNSRILENSEITKISWTNVAFLQFCHRLHK